MTSQMMTGSVCAFTLSTSFRLFSLIVKTQMVPIWLSVNWVFHLILCSWTKLFPSGCLHAITSTTSYLPTSLPPPTNLKLSKSRKISHHPHYALTNTPMCNTDPTPPQTKHPTITQHYTTHTQHHLDVNTHFLSSELNQNPPPSISNIPTHSLISH